MDNFKSIKELREDERPRERLVSNGAGSLSDSELIAILLGTGTNKKSAIDIGREILENYGDLNNLISCDLSQFKRIKGIGTAKAVTLAATFEVARRIKAKPYNQKYVITSPNDLANYFIPKFRGLMKEEFYVIILNSSNQIIRETLISSGLLNASLVHPREVFRLAITENAASIILIHNHPTGNINPSKEDISITNQLVESGKLIDIKVLDHLIIAGEDYYSFAKNGLI